MKEHKTFKAVSFVLGIVQTVLIVALLAVAVMSFGSRVPFLAQRGLTFYAVVSGSMEPAVPVGSLIYAGRYKLENLKKGDIITFTVQGEANSKPVVVTHRINEVIKKERTEKGPEGKDKAVEEYSFRTKGDANSEVDAQPVAAGNVLGHYKWHLPYLGRLSLFAQNPVGFGLLVLLPAAILIVWEITSLILHFKKEYQLKSEVEINKLKAELHKHQTSHE